MNTKKRILPGFLTALLILVVVAGCKKDQPAPTPTPEPPGDIIVSDSTVVVDATLRQSIMDIDTSNFTITMDASAVASADLRVGDILVDSASAMAPNGYLRRVTAISNNKAGGVDLQTSQALLTDAVTKGSIAFRTGKVTMAKVRNYALSDGVKMTSLKNTDFNVFSFDYEKTFTNDHGEITISGHTDLDIDFFFDFDWEMDWLSLPPAPEVTKFETGVEINQSASISAIAEEGAVLEERVSLARFYFVPWTFMVGPVPVVFVPQIELFVEVDGSIVAVYTASASESFTGRVGTSYTSDNGWHEIAESDYQDDVVAPNLDASAYIETHVGPEISLLLYGVAGPFTNVTGCAKMSAELYTTTLNWDLTFLVGSRAQVGVELDVLGFSADWHKDLCLFSDTLLHLHDEPFGDHLYLVTPVQDQPFLMGDDVPITTSFTGEVPDEVRFYCDYNLAFTDYEAPFEYTWNTEGMAEGSHVISVYSYIGGEEKSMDNVSFNLFIPQWEPIDLANLGLDENTDVNDIHFISTTMGMMTVSGSGVGKVLFTSDAGQTWTQQFSSGEPLTRVIMRNNVGSALFLQTVNAGFGEVSHKVMETFDNGLTLTESTYGQFNQPSFQWHNVFDLTLNGSGDMVAVCKDLGIPYEFKVMRADAYGAPVGEFKLPYPNEYGEAPKIVMYGDVGYLYNVFSEDEPGKSFVMKTTDGGVTWTGADFNVVTTAAQLHGASMPDEDHLWIVGEEDGDAIVLITGDGGASWTKVWLTGTPPFGDTQFTSADEGYATALYGTSDPQPKLYHTTDGGHNWDPMIDSRSSYGMSSVFFLGIDFGLVAGKGPQVLRYSVY